MSTSLFLSVLLIALLMTTPGCVSGPPTDLIIHDDHRGLADWYQHEAVRLRGTADEMRRMRKQYDNPLFQPSPKETKEELIAHCELFIKYYTQAAHEADALAKIHRKEDKAIP
jgi:hypothetical protein